MSRTSSRRAVVFVALLSSVLMVQGWPSAGADRSVAVGQGGDRFSPAAIDIAAGDTVVWTNHGGWHNVHGDGFSNAVSDAKWTFRHTFHDPGTYPYVCDVHPNMRGTVTVSAPPPATTEPASEPSPAAPPGPEPEPEPEPEPARSSEPTRQQPAVAAPRPASEPTAVADAEPTADGADDPSEPPRATPWATATEPVATDEDDTVPSPEPTPSASAAPSPSSELAAPVADGADGGRGPTVAVVAALLLAAAGAGWLVRSRRS